jgi:DNA-binding PadR family transcriptional regulator
MTPDDQNLLRSYASGPRIWDAASIVPGVYRLEGQGLIEPAPPEDDGSPPSRGAYQLTAKGRRVLAETQP